MVALQIRDVSPEVRDVLAERARAQGQSLQTFLLTLVEAEARRSRNLALLDRFARRTDGSTLSASEAAELLAEERAQRDEQLARRQAGVGGISDRR